MANAFINWISTIGSDTIYMLIAIFLVIIIWRSFFDRFKF